MNQKYEAGASWRVYVFYGDMYAIVKKKADYPMHKRDREKEIYGPTINFISSGKRLVDGYYMY